MSTTTVEATKADKSIVNPKYRDKYKEQDWLGTLIGTQIAKTKVVEKMEGEGDKAKKVKVTVPDGIDSDILLSLGDLNGVPTEGLKAQVGSHGFVGRARMTIRNALQARIKQRHGLFVPASNKSGKSWVEADADWLKAKGAPEAPSHDRGGEKFAVAKAEKAPKATKEAKAS